MPYPTKDKSIPLVTHVCSDCGSRFHKERAHCPYCGGMALKFARVFGRGKSRQIREMLG